MGILIEGVSFENDKFTFDFKNDNKNDIIHLQFKNNKSVTKKFGIDVYSGWILNKNNADSNEISLFRRELKHNSSLINESDKKILIDKAIEGFNNTFSLSSYDLVIYPKSSSTLVSEIAKEIKAADPNLLVVNDAIVKNKLENIKIDYDSYLRSAKNPEEKEKRRKQIANDFKHATKTGDFQIKKVHMFRKKLFSNFLVFSDSLSKEIFNMIEGGRVLLVDDILTTGSTLYEMLKLIYQHNPSNITYFILIR